jgi:hypothetical protein
MKDLKPFNNKFKELISIQYCTFIILSVVVVGGGGGGGGGLTIF